MDVKKVALLVGALVIAIVTGVMAKNMFAGAGANSAAAAPAVPMGPKVLVARKPLPVGTIIDASSLAFQEWPKELVQGAYYMEGKPDSKMELLVGTVVRNAITAGQPVTRGSLVGPKDRGFLAAALGPGMRAVTVPVTKVSGVSGFVFPGDRVDLVLTQTVTGSDGGQPLKVSETIIRNLRVLATDQRLDGKGDSGKMEAKYSDNITVEATPRIAEKIEVAQAMGSLSLSLRSIADNTTDLQRAIASGDVKLPKNATPEQERQMMLQYATQPQDNGTSFVTGGDVSRFGRRSAPSNKEDLIKTAAGALNNFSSAISGGRVGGGSNAGGMPSGPTVRVARGNDVTYVPVGGR
ncbi:Flp pilus assembly protein CpaB [Sphingomonas sp. ASV193]|uniref:Flp pilus assembly protein CpaB n=1 Tax=Sphingomonas sp. ASV193 TaxID=3144405 RepID=UPI0032E8D533